MNEAFLAAAVALLVALLPCGWVCWRAEPESRLVALSLAGTIQSLVLLLIAVGSGEPAIASVAVVLVAMSAGGSLAFARFPERWL